MTEEKRNRKYKDNGGRLIFENATLCSQFLREYTGLELLRNITPDDVEDMTERFLPMFTEERDSDVVKRVRLHTRDGETDNGEPFVVALIEHKSSVDYNVSMQMLHYMSYIWEEYEKSMENLKKGSTKVKDFRYPPILPIVYYEDTDTWTSSIRLHDRIFLSEVFANYIPDYRYLLFKLQDCNNSDLISKNDEISLIMLINKLRGFSDFSKISFPKGYLEDISKKTTGDVLIVLAKLIETYLRNINLPDEEIYSLTDRIKEGDMNRLFEHFEGYDIQKVRKESKAEGKDLLLISLIRKNLEKSMPQEKIVEVLMVDSDMVREVAGVIEMLKEKGENCEDDELILEKWRSLQMSH